MRIYLEKIDDVIQREMQNPEFKFYWDKLIENPDADLDELEKEYHRLCNVSEELSKFYLEVYQGNIEIDTYKNERGDDPIKEFYSTLNIKESAKVESKLKEFQKVGMFAKPPLVKQLNDFIYEFRVQVNKIYIRILFFRLPNNKVLFTNGFKKKTDKTPPGEIEIALQRRNNYISRNNLDLQKGRKRR